MKVLIVNRFFGGAQIPTGRMAEDVALKLVEAGHEVVALASSGEYVGAARRADGIRHTAEGIRLELVPVPKWMPRALAWLWFTWQARKRIPRLDWDVCVLMTDPPLLPLLARRAAGMRHEASGIQREAEGMRRVAVWLMDLYPEALAASGRIAKSSPLYKWYFNKRQRALAASDLLICLGEAQKERLQTKRRKDQELESELQTATGAERRRVAPQPNSIRPTRIAVVPPWDDRGNIDLSTEGSLKNLALYAGNLGEAHCFEEILAAALYLPGYWTIRFAARGAKFAALKEKAGQSGHGLTRINTDSFSAGDTGGKPLPWEITAKSGAVVHVSGYASEGETPKLLASARVHLITMAPGWEGIVVPSKLYGCIRTGRPVLFIGPENADTAREIRVNNWGKVLPPGGSGEEVAAAILELAARPTRAVQLKQGAAEVAQLIQSLATDGHGCKA